MAPEVLQPSPAIDRRPMQQPVPEDMQRLSNWDDPAGIALLAPSQRIPGVAWPAAPAQNANQNRVIWKGSSYETLPPASATDIQTATALAARAVGTTVGAPLHRSVTPLVPVHAKGSVASPMHGSPPERSVTASQALHRRLSGPKEHPSMVPGDRDVAPLRRRSTSPAEPQATPQQMHRYLSNVSLSLETPQPVGMHVCDVGMASAAAPRSRSHSLEEALRCGGVGRDLGSSAPLMGYVPPVVTTVVGSASSLQTKPTASTASRPAPGRTFVSRTQLVSPRLRQAAAEQPSQQREASPPLRRSQMVVSPRRQQSTASRTPNGSLHVPPAQRTLSSASSCAALSVEPPRSSQLNGHGERKRSSPRSSGRTDRVDSDGSLSYPSGSASTMGEAQRMLSKAPASSTSSLLLLAQGVGNWLDALKERGGDANDVSIGSPQCPTRGGLTRQGGSRSQHVFSNGDADKAPVPPLQPGNKLAGMSASNPSLAVASAGQLPLTARSPPRQKADGSIGLPRPPMSARRTASPNSLGSRAAASAAAAAGPSTTGARSNGVTRLPTGGGSAAPTGLPTPRRASPPVATNRRPSPSTARSARGASPNTMTAAQSTKTAAATAAPQRQLPGRRTNPFGRLG
eukprot:TRINITY_DN100711_c0_g1_i1.p1 TRINITY_DN100711_c0_g1~~TRINITY_DN100711_c0_g1_i1.p1  ORF type:complete len:628 (+),score=90.23 TRINITY_DN100711_c0_g1_i1:178-2061(+)